MKRTQNTGIPGLFALVLGLILTACSSGGDGGGLNVRFFRVTPNESEDLTPDDPVIVEGVGFDSVQLLAVRFDGSPGFNREVLNDGEISVRPPPRNRPGPVVVEVEMLFDEEVIVRSVPGNYTYVGEGGSVSPPQPQTIVPTSFTATGAEEFRIAGTNLGLDGSTITVTFGTIGSVSATVSGSGQFAVGNAPVSQGVPPGTAITVNVENSAGDTDVPTSVFYVHPAPTFLSIPFQEFNNGASRPVRITNGLAIMATAGASAVWGNGDDDLVLIQGPPNAVGQVSVLGAAATTLRNLDPNNSIPIVLDSDTVVVFSPGVSTATQGDELILVITNLTGVPVVSSVAATHAARSPLARLSDTRVGYIRQAQGTNGQDELVVLEFSGGTISQTYGPIEIGVGERNAGLGRGNRTLPFSPDGDSIFVWSKGGNNTYGDGDDLVTRFKISTTETASVNAPHMVVKPVAVSATRVVGAAGPLANIPNLADAITQLELSGNVFTRTQTNIGAFVDAAALTPIQVFGDGHVALLTGGNDGLANNNDDEVSILVDDGNGGLTRAAVAFGARPMLARSGDGALLVWGRGPNNVLGDQDDRTIRVDPVALTLVDFIVGPPWNHGFAPLTDLTRGFAIGRGLDNTANTGDETLLVYQGIHVGTGVDGNELPLSNNVTQNRLRLSEPFIPIGPGWGVVQSVGQNGFVLSADDRIVIAFY